MEVQRASGSRILELDTVRALHQTVVSLRAALEASQTELHNLRQKYESHSDTNYYTDTIYKLTRENSSLKQKILAEQGEHLEEEVLSKELIPESKQDSTRKVKFDIKDEKGINVEDSAITTDEEESANIENAPFLDQESQEFIEEETESLNTEKEVFETEQEDNKNINTSDTQKETKITHVEDVQYIEEIIIGNTEDKILIEDNGEYETKIELESKFDLTIKVSSARTGATTPSRDSNKLKFDGGCLKSINVKTISTESIEVVNENFEENTGNSEGNLAMAGSREGNDVNRSDDTLNVQVKITSEENLLIEPYHSQGSNPDHLNMEPDDISIRSISEGDNSVFSETIGGGGGSKKERVCEQDSVSGNESEEVDDIELIFTTDDTKELTGFQEDLVSITEGDHWTGAPSDSSTPVLLKFNILNSESQRSENKRPINKTTDNFDYESQKKSTLVDTDSSSKKGILRRKNHPNLNNIDSENQDKTDRDSQERKPLLRSSSSKNYLEASDTKQQYRKSFESNESYSFDNQKSFSFDNTKSSSFERGSSVDVETRELSFDHRDESLDQFDVLKTTLRTQYSVCVETDISKCGMLEDDFSGNINVRRNTCPNPLQYRPLAHREVVRGSARPLLVPPGPRAPRRSSAAQTHISALPAHWSSDTHLSRKILPLALTTLPSKVNYEGAPTRLAAPMPGRTTRRTEETRRVLLSDIGFTSMVPELSRSAEPLWAGLGPAGGAPLCCVHHAQRLPTSPSSHTSPSSPTRSSRYWSKSSMQRSASGKVGDCGHGGSHRVSFTDQPMRWRGSLPELRPLPAHCCQRGLFGKGVGKGISHGMGDSEDSTDELLDEADRFLTSSIGCLSTVRTLQDEFCPSRYSRPYLPNGPRQLRLGHLVKVIAPHGRIALGKVKYVGIAGGPWSGGGPAPTYVGLQMAGSSALGLGGGDGSFRGRRYFHCEQGKSLFVPFSKVVMAWADY